MITPLGGGLSPLGVGRGYASALMYKDKVLGYSPLAYWALDETSGSTAVDATGSGFDGTSSNVTWAGEAFVDGGNAPTFDGTTSSIDVFSAGLSAVYPHSAGSLMAWWLTTSAVMNDGNQRRVFNAEGGASYVIRKLATPATTMQLFRQARSYPFTYPGTVWTQGVITWDEAANFTHFYVNGSSAGSLIAGTATGSLSQARIGAQNPGSFLWSGAVAHVAIFDYVLSAAQVADLATV